MKKLIIMAVLAWFVGVSIGVAVASESDDWDDDDYCYYCDEGDDGEDGEDGEDGQDGEDGADGIDGVDGVDGIDGINGTNGIDGVDGVNADLDSLYSLNKSLRLTTLAFGAAQVHLPQDKSSRLTFNIANDGVSNGIGLGYAYRFEGDSRTAITFQLGAAGGERVGKIGLSFEF